MFAVIKSGGRQYKVAVGQTLEVNRLPVEDGAQVKFEEVLLISDADGSRVGTPLLNSAVVVATVTRQARGKKLIVFKYKPKKRYRHRRGHRQELTILSIDDILNDGISLITGEPPEAKKTPAEDTSAEPEATAETETASETPTAEVTPTSETTTRRRRTANVDDTESETEE